MDLLKSSNNYSLILFIITFFLPACSTEKIILFDKNSTKKDFCSLLDSPKKNDVAVVLFTSVDCPIANRMSPEIRKCQNLASDLNIKFINIYPSTNTKQKEISSHKKNYLLKGTFLHDSDQKWASLFNATITPECFVLIEKNQRWEVLYQGRVCNLYPALGRPLNKASTHELYDSIKLAKEKPDITKNMYPQNTKAVGCQIELIKK